ncbi:MAG: TraR/DksA family transcriptional regulator [Smithella sp.]|nr:TraR/DksA family transcriptional regulator [Smithella sp.]
MNKDKNDDIRQYLVRKMKTLMSSANGAIQKLKISNDKLADPCDQASVEASKNVELHFWSKEWKTLLDIQETILRIDHGLYGICDHCGRQISSKRLKAAPMSKLCVECQQKMENRQNKSKEQTLNTTRISYHHAC